MLPLWFEMDTGFALEVTTALVLLATWLTTTVLRPA